MKRKIMALAVLALLLCLLMGRAADGREYWLKTEENGLSHPVEYLHELAEREPGKARAHLGKSVSFVAPFDSEKENVKLDYYGRIGRLLRLSVPGGREFLVEDSGNTQSYHKGEPLKISGRITELKPERVLLLNVVGTPGWPNDIRIEKVK